MPVAPAFTEVAGNWAYLYRAVDSAGATIEFMLSPKRGLMAAKLFLSGIIRRCPLAAGHQRGRPSGVCEESARNPGVAVRVA
jgi:hypothetical protein